VQKPAFVAIGAQFLQMYNLNKTGLNRFKLDELNWIELAPTALCDSLQFSSEIVDGDVELVNLKPEMSRIKVNPDLNRPRLQSVITD